MLPTTYRGNATLDGEDFEAELRLDDQHVRLAHANGQHSEVLRWPLTSVAVESSRGGDYVLQAGVETFSFAPFVDDGLGDEIALRMRFASLPPVADPAAVPDVTPASIADEARTTPARRARLGAHKSGRGIGKKKPVRVNTSPNLGPRGALAALGLLAVIVVGVAVLSGRGNNAPEIAAAGDDPVFVSGDTLPFTDGDPADQASVSVPITIAPTDDTVPAPTTTVATPTTTAATTPSTTPETTIPTTTTVPSETTPSTVAPPPPAVSAFQRTPEELVEAWSSQAKQLGADLTPAGLSTEAGEYRFEVGPFVVVSGAIGGDGMVDSLQFFGDPSGTVADSRAMLGALGLAVAQVEPVLPPEGRRDLLYALGLDVNRPTGAGLDGSLTYREIDYALRWDSDLARLVFDARPHVPGEPEPEAEDT